MFFKSKENEICEDIIKILDIIYDKNRWTQRAMAKDENDIRLFDPFDKRAKKYCIVGLLYKLEAKEKTKDFLNREAYSMGFYDISALNDQTNHNIVISFLIRCLVKLNYNIKKLEKYMSKVKTEKLETEMDDGLFTL